MENHDCIHPEVTQYIKEEILDKRILGVMVWLKKVFIIARKFSQMLNEY